MNFIIFAVIFILYAVLIFTTCGNMKIFSLSSKIIYIILGIIINLIITIFIINISINNIENKEVYAFIKKIDIIIFTAVNGIVSMPTIIKNVNNYKMKIIEKEKMSKKIALTLIVYLIFIILEGSYIKGLSI